MATKIKKRGHTHVVPKDLVKKALKAAKELEQVPMPSKEDIVRIYKEGLEEAKRLQKLLKPEWFVEDKDKPSRASPTMHLEEAEKLHQALLREKSHRPLLGSRGKKGKKK